MESEGHDSRILVFLVSGWEYNFHHYLFSCPKSMRPDTQPFRGSGLRQSHHNLKACIVHGSALSEGWYSRACEDG